MVVSGIKGIEAFEFGKISIIGLKGIKLEEILKRYSSSVVYISLFTLFKSPNSTTTGYVYLIEVIIITRHFKIFFFVSEY